MEFVRPPHPGRRLVESKPPMLTLRDFFHLPQLDPLVRQITAERSGLLVVAGLDPRPNAGEQRTGFLPGGRHALFGMLLDETLASQADKSCVVVTRDRQLVRVPRQFRRRVAIELVKPAEGYASHIAAAVRDGAGLLAIDRLSEENLLPALEAALGGVCVLTQFDTIFRGAEIARQMAGMGATQDLLAGLRWALAVQRLPALCPKCKQPAAPDPVQLERLQAYPVLPAALDPAPVFTSAVGCPHCQFSGRLGDVAVFDVFRAGGPENETGPPDSRLPMETYVWELVRSGHLPLEDYLDFDLHQLRHTYTLLAQREQALIETQATLETRLLQLEATHKVLEQRTEALVSLQTIGQAMIVSQSLEELAGHLCRHACQLCDAERAILYTQRLDGQVEVLAVAGWDPMLVRTRVDMRLILDAEVGPEPRPFNFPPPGVPVLFENYRARAGLAVSLYTQNEWVGLMILHASKKDRFLPGEVALLQTFANQAALAIQRAGLVEQLRDKIEQLEAAQLELAQKERLEKEMELARQVQQSLLPRSFPQLAGYRFAARCEPARQVGGDFYDVIPLADGRLGLAIGDVSDKGMPAALYMATTRSLLRTEARRERSPAAVLTSVHHLLKELGEPNMFVTLFYGAIDPKKAQFVYARAGHDYPYLVRDGALRRLDGEGVPLGLLEEAWFRLEEQRISLAPQDRLVLYTDGLSDVLDEGGKLFERAGLERILRAYSSETPEDMCESIFADLSRYRGETEQYDDMTLLVVEIG